MTYDIPPRMMMHLNSSTYGYIAMDDISQKRSRQMHKIPPLLNYNTTPSQSVPSIQLLLLLKTLVIVTAGFVTSVSLLPGPGLLYHFVQPCHAATNVITSYQIKCSPCAIETPWRLDVVSMINNAELQGKEYALALFIGGQFAEPVEIDATGTWPSNALYMNVTVINPGFDTSSYNSQWLFLISGELKRGSVVSIQGGNFVVPGTMVSQCLVVFGSSLILDESTVSIVGTVLTRLGAFRAVTSITLTNSTVILRGATISLSKTSGLEQLLASFPSAVGISGRSTMSINTNIVTTTPPFSHNIINFGDTITLHTTSVLDISNNAVTVTHKSWGAATDKLVRFVNMGKPGLGISMANFDTTCTINDNTMTVSSQVLSSNDFEATLLRIDGFLVKTGAAFSIRRNTLILAGSISHNGYRVQGLISALGDITLEDTDTSLHINNNRIEVGGSSIKATYLYAAIVDAGNTDLSSNCVLQIANNVVEVVPITTVQTLSFLLSVMDSSDMDISSGATILITGNTIVQPVGTDNIPVSATWLRNANIHLESSSTFTVDYNTISLQQHVPNISVSYYYPVGTIDSLSIVGASTTLRIAHNIVEYANIRTEPTGSTGIRKVALYYIDEGVSMENGAQLDVTNNTVTVGHGEMVANSPLHFYLLKGKDFTVTDGSYVGVKDNSMTFQDGIINSAAMTFLFFMIDGSQINLESSSSFTYSGCKTNITLSHISGNVSVYTVQWVTSMSPSGGGRTSFTFEDNTNLLSISSPPLAEALSMSYPGIGTLWSTDLHNCDISVARNSITLLLDYPNSRTASTTARVNMLSLPDSVAMSNTKLNINENNMNVTVLKDGTGRTILDVVVGLDIRCLNNVINIDGTSSLNISNNHAHVSASTFKAISLLRFQNTVAAYVGTKYSMLENVLDVSASVSQDSLRPQEVHLLNSLESFDGLEFNVRDNYLTFPSASSSSVAWVALLATNTRSTFYTCNNNKNLQPCFVHRGSRKYECVSSPGAPGASINECSTFSQSVTYHTQTTSRTIDHTRSRSHLPTRSPTSTTTPNQSATTSHHQTSSPTFSTTYRSQSLSSSHSETFQSHSSSLTQEPSSSQSVIATATLTHNTVTESISVSDRTSISSINLTVSLSTSPPTPTPSLTTTLRDYCLAIPSCLSKGATVRATTHTNITDIDLQQNTTSTCTTPHVDIGYGLWSASGALVVVTLSGEASLGAAVRPRSQSTAAAVWHRVGPPQSAVEYAIVEVGRNTTANISVVSTTSPPPAAWCVVAVRYAGTSSLTGTTVSARLPMGEILACRVLTPGASAFGLLSLTLVDSPPLPPNVGVVADTGVVVTSVTGAVGGVTAGIVQSGIANAMVGMLRCSEFDAEAEVDFVSNPGGWAVGRPALQHQRGSLLLVLILMSSVLFVAGCVVCVMYARGENTSTMMAAFGEARLPSLLVVPVLVSSSMALPSGTSVLLYGDSSGMDYFLALVVMVPLWAYLLLYAYRSTYGMRVGLEKIPEDTQAPKVRLSGVKRLANFMMEPTYGPVVPTVRARVFAADLDDDDSVLVVGQREDPEAPEPWLRRNYFFVADRRWAGYGGVEAIVGSLVDMLEGIPLTTRSVGVCVARPAAMCALLVVLMLLLVFKWPNSVRFQQYSALSVTSLLLVANVLVVVNAVVVAPDLEEAAGQLIGVVSLVIVVLSMLDLLATIASIVPALRRSMGISGSSLTASIGRMRAAVVRKKEAADAQLAQPLLPITGAHDDDVDVDDNTPSEASSTGSYHVVVDTHNTEGEREMKTMKREESRRANSPTSPSSSASRQSSSATTPNFTRKTWASKSSALSGMYRNIGDATAYEEELEAMKTPAEIEAERMRLFTEEVMRDL